jgi:AP2 domain
VVVNFVGLRRRSAQSPDRLLYQAMPKCKSLPPVEVLNRWFSLDEETGNLFWKESSCTKIRPGQRAGCLGNFTSGQRWVVRVPGYKGYFYRYRIIWKMVTGYDPSDAIDHYDGNTVNDSPTNLVDGGKSWNGRNKKVTAVSGFRGVVANKNKNTTTWRAALTQNGDTVYIGTFASPEAAAEAYEVARQALKPLHPATVEADATQ